jgi:replication-associated recombination protein RarA
MEALRIFPQSASNFPVSLSEKYRPRCITQFIGLEKPKKILAKFAANPYPSAWIFYGNSGVGKTSMALALAEEIGAELHHIPSQKCNAANIEEVIRLCHYLPMTPGGLHLVLVDEADAMTPAAQLALLSKLDSTAFPPNTVFIFTANSLEGLESRFLSRTRQVEFSSYGMACAIAGLLRQVWQSEGGKAEETPDVDRISKNSRNNVRDALMTLETELLSA